MDPNVEYFQTSTYGRFIHTTPDKEKDLDLINFIVDKINTVVDVEPSLYGQTKFHEGVRMILSTYTAPECRTLNVFSSSKDARGRPLERLVVSDKDGWQVVIDLKAELDVSIDISKIRRFACLHLPPKLTKCIQPKELIPHMHYVMKIWNSPAGYYKLTLCDLPLSIPYSYEIERDRSIVGLPIFVTPEEKNIYERSDFDVRRAIFRETFDLYKR